MTLGYPGGRSGYMANMQRGGTIPHGFGALGSEHNIGPNTTLISGIGIGGMLALAAFALMIYSDRK